MDPQHHDHKRHASRLLPNRALSLVNIPAFVLRVVHDMAQRGMTREQVLAVAVPIIAELIIEAGDAALNAHWNREHVEENVRAFVQIIEAADRVCCRCLP